MRVTQAFHSKRLKYSILSDARIMKTFGHFDDSGREYVITDPKTPWPWVKSEKYGSIDYIFHLLIFVTIIATSKKIFIFVG